MANGERKGGRNLRPTGDIRVAGTFEASSKNLGDCTQMSWGHMWQRYRDIYTKEGYSEWELRKIHTKWKALMAEVRGAA